MTDVLPGLLTPPANVRAPERTVAPDGLLETALEVQEPVEQRGGRDVEPWTGSFLFQPDRCADGGIWVPCIDVKTQNLNPGGSGSGSGEQLKSLQDAEAEILFVPFLVEGEFTCSTRGFQVAEYARRARRALELIEGTQIESEFWTGAQMREHPTGNANQSLVLSVQADGILNPGLLANPTPVSPRVALALLSQGIANCAGSTRGFIHATPFLAELWAGDDMIAREGGRLVTKTRGNWIVSGAGYTGQGPIVVGDAAGGGPGLPAVPAENQVWAFATGPVNWRAGRVVMIPDESEAPELLAQAMRPRREDGTTHGPDNVITYRAERFAAAVFDDCCILAVLVDLSLGTC